MLHFIRLLIVGIIFYWILKIVKSMFGSGKPDVEIKGKPKQEPIDLSQENIEDVDFKEIKNNKRE